MSERGWEGQDWLRQLPIRRLGAFGCKNGFPGALFVLEPLNWEFEPAKRLEAQLIARDPESPSPRVPENQILALLLQGPFVLEHALLEVQRPFHAPGKTSQPIPRQHPVARHEQGQGILSHGAPHGPRGPWPLHSCGELAIGQGLARPHPS